MQKGNTLIFLLVGIVLFAGVTGGAYYLGRKATSSQSPIPTVTSQTPQPTQVPTASNASPAPNTTDKTANWKDYCKDIINDPKTKYKECNTMESVESSDDEKACREIGGQYDSCTSPCRHDSSTRLCISMCIPLCIFQ